MSAGIDDPPPLVPLGLRIAHRQMRLLRGSLFGLGATYGTFGMRVTYCFSGGLVCLSVAYLVQRSSAWSSALDRPYR